MQIKASRRVINSKQDMDVVEEARIYGFGGHVASHLRKGASAAKPEERPHADEKDENAELQEEYTNTKRAFLQREMIRKYLELHQNANKRA